MFTWRSAHTCVATRCCWPHWHTHGKSLFRISYLFFRLLLCAEDQTVDRLHHTCASPPRDVNGNSEQVMFMCLDEGFTLVHPVASSSHRFILVSNIYCFSIVLEVSPCPSWFVFFWIVMVFRYAHPRALLSSVDSHRPPLGWSQSDVDDGTNSN